MICAQCSYENPAQNRFCGMCGSRLEQPAVSPVQEPPSPAAEPSERAALTGDEQPVAPVAPKEEPVVGTSGKNALPETVPLPDSPMPAPQEPVTTAPEPLVFHGADVPRLRSSVSGPSFLGLGEEVDGQPTDYLLEEEPRRSHTRRNIVLAAVVLVGVLIVLEWRANRPGSTAAGPMELLHLKLPKKNAQGTQPPAAATPSPVDNSTPQLVAEPVQPATQPTQSPTPEPTQMAAAATPSPSASPTATPSPVESAQQNERQNAPEPPQEATAEEDDAVPVTTARAQPKRPAVPQSESVEEEAPEQAPKRTLQEDPVRAGQTELQQGVAAGATEAGRMWLWKSTAKGNPTAPVLLAQMYLDGNGVPKNCEQAILLLQTASRKNNPRARSKLADLYARGQCVPQDRVQAYRWLSAALEANPGSEWLDQNRESLWNQMTPGERQRARPFR